MPNPARQSCRECGSPSSGQFCATACKTAWNNRRRTRGAVLYDFFMAHRFERDATADARLWTLMCRLGTDWVAEDHNERGGRPSWRDHRKVLAERPQLKAQIGRVR